jgi:hypothetical protein
LSAGLRTQDAFFDFRVQLQTDPDAMPLNVSVEWKETDSAHFWVATLRIHAAGDSSSELKREQLSFNPWHALAGIVRSAA